MSSFEKTGNERIKIQEV